MHCRRRRSAGFGRAGPRRRRVRIEFRAAMMLANGTSRPFPIMLLGSPVRSESGRLSPAARNASICHSLRSAKQTAPRQSAPGPHQTTTHVTAPRDIGQRCDRPSAEIGNARAGSGKVRRSRSPAAWLRHRAWHSALIGGAPCWRAEHRYIPPGAGSSFCAMIMT